jgi:hypothetical protein
LPLKLKAEIGRELDRIALVTTQLASVERSRDARVRKDGWSKTTQPPKC